MTEPRALVLHDDPRTLALIRSVVAAEGFSVAASETPWQLLESAQEPHPHLVLAGLAGLEERDLEVIGVVRRRWPRAVILVLFPGLLRERAARALDLGADGYLPEPFYPSELAALARGAVSRITKALPAPAEPAREPAREPTRAEPQAPATPSAHSDEAIARLAAGVAHSIRNPLQILELQIGSFEADGRLDAAGMRDQLARIAAVTESLTRFSGRRKLDTRVVEVNALVQRVFSELSRPQHPVRVEPSSERLEVLGAPDLLRAALEAVLARAQRVTTGPGEIRVETSLVESGGAPFAEIVVTDAGPAFTAAQLETVFDPFPEADHVVEGSGMEMAAAAGIVRNHGGTASARPAEHAGTAIVLRLPVRGHAAARARREDS